MSSTPLAETDEDVFDAVPETERLDSSLQKAKAQLSIKTRRHRPSRSRLRDSLSSTEGEDSLDGKSYSGLLSGSCSPLHVSLRCPSPFFDLHPSSSPARKDRAFIFETAEMEKKEQNQRSAYLLNPSSPTHLLKGDDFQQRQEDPSHIRNREHLQKRQLDNPQLGQNDLLKVHLKDNSHLHHRDHPHLHQEDHTHLHQRDHTHMRQGDHIQLCQDKRIHVHQKDHTHLRNRDHLQGKTHLTKRDRHQEDYTHLHKADHLQNDHTNLAKTDHLQKDHTHMHKRDRFQKDHTHIHKWDHLQKDHTHTHKRDHLQKDHTHMHKRDQLQKDQVHVAEKDQVQQHGENRSLLRQKEYSQSEDDSRDISSEEPSSPTVLLDKKTRRRFLDLGVTLRRTYGKVRRERANRHAAENREPDGAESRSSRSSGPPFVSFAWLSERIRGSSSPKNSSQSPAKSRSEDEGLIEDNRPSRNESSQPYQSLLDHSDEGCDEHMEPRAVKKKTVLPFSLGGREGTENQNGVQKDKRDNGHEEDGQKLLTSQSQCKHINS